jgi:hypothetical protein
MERSYEGVRAFLLPPAAPAKLRIGAATFPPKGGLMRQWFRLETAELPAKPVAVPQVVSCFRT